MVKNMIIGILIVVIAGGAVLYLVKKDNPSDMIACTTEAKLCPDGSAVGREGPLCEFAECPTVTEQADQTPDSGLDQEGIIIAVRQILEDSRCPLDVVCIWAGTVKVRADVSDEGAQSVVFTLNETKQFEGFEITLIDVLPAPYSETTITDNDYRFVFRITSPDRKAQEITTGLKPVVE